MSKLSVKSVLTPHAGEALDSSARGARTFLLIQVLRGVAALMVVWHHATLMENERLDSTRGVWLSAASEVDLFFVISGFVMVVVCALSAKVIYRLIELPMTRWFKEQRG